MLPQSRDRSARVGAPRRTRTHAFTLLELLTVIAVIAVLSTISVGLIRSSRQQAAIARTRAELAALASALEDYRRYYGDYPQLGEFSHAAAVPTSPTLGPATNTVEAKLFNCLTGVFGPAAFASQNRLSGPNFLEGSRFLDPNSESLNGSLTTSFLIPATNAPNPPFKTEQSVCLMDPWGRRYQYYYKDRRNPPNWQAAGYVLYSLGPDGAQFSTPPANGVLTTAFLSAAANADNIYATP